MENEIFEFICNLGEFNIQRNNREIISPKELDLYFKSFSATLFSQSSSDNELVGNILVLFQLFMEKWK